MKFEFCYIFPTRSQLAINSDIEKAALLSIVGFIIAYDFNASRTENSYHWNISVVHSVLFFEGIYRDP